MTQPLLTARRSPWDFQTKPQSTEAIMGKKATKAERLRDKMIRMCHQAKFDAEPVKEVVVMPEINGRSLVYQSLRGGNRRFVYRISEDGRTHSFVINRHLPQSMSDAKNILEALATARRMLEDEVLEKEMLAGPRTHEEVLEHPILLSALMAFWEKHEANQGQMDRLMNSVLIIWTGSEESATEIAEQIAARPVLPKNDIRVTGFPRNVEH